MEIESKKLTHKYFGFVSNFQFEKVKKERI